MIQRPVAATKPGRGRNRAMYELERVGHRLFERPVERESRGDCGG
jgi:hypothetical protein